MASNECEVGRAPPRIQIAHDNAYPVNTQDWREGLSQSDSIGGTANQQWMRSAECIRAALATVALSTLSIFFLFPALLLLHYPESYSESGVLIEGSVVTLLGSYDTLWYSQSHVSNANSSIDYNYTAQLFLKNCSDLQPKSNNSLNFFLENTTTEIVNVPIAECLPAYFLSSSVVNITLIISQAPPTGSGSLYLFDSYDDFTSFKNEILSSYVTVHPVTLMNNTNSSFSFIFNRTGFYFFGLHLPANTRFSYCFSAMRLFYNPANFFAPTCNLTLDSTECSVSLDSSDRQACLLVLPSGDTEMFTTLNEHVSRKTWNAVNTFLLALFASSLMLCVCVPMYYWWVLRVRPKLVVWWSHKRRSDRMKDKLLN